MHQVRLTRRARRRREDETIEASASEPVREERDPSSQDDLLARIDDVLGGAAH